MMKINTFLLFGLLVIGSTTWAIDNMATSKSNPSATEAAGANNPVCDTCKAHDDPSNLPAKPSYPGLSSPDGSTPVVNPAVPGAADTSGNPVKM